MKIRPDGMFAARYQVPGIIAVKHTHILFAVRVCSYIVPASATSAPPHPENYTRLIGSYIVATAATPGPPYPHNYTRLIGK